jgi:pseudaminic acid biosynthesis-associated methylase
VAAHSKAQLEDSMQSDVLQISAETPQLEQWTGDFGRQFTDRNALTPAEMDARYAKEYGVARTAMNREFLDDLPRDSRILEVGSNIGNQLVFLQSLAFTDLWGVEAADYGLELARRRTSGMNLVKGSAFDLPFKDGWFDMVFTSVVLIHISPADVPRAMSEIYRCSRQYIWGFEYYADTLTDVPYRGKAEMCWKADFARRYMDLFPDLKLVKQKLYKYTSDDNMDAMFLLEKTGTR